ncbi:MAG TPA: TIGR03790 family protein [Rhodocyclaceae bacterium]|nr:TIGR03790 family protein [Rhodocyclaceae bacterium]
MNTTAAARFLVLAWAICALPCQAQFRDDIPAYSATVRGLRPYQLGVVVNSADPASMEVGQYYMAARRIPSRNLLQVSLPTEKRSISSKELDLLRQLVSEHFDAAVQALVLVWTTPYAVECQSITAALSLGFDPSLCKQTCQPSRPNPYFDFVGDRPYARFGFRPSFLLPTHDIALSKALINRGISADRSRPAGTAYLLQTSDPHRNSRAPYFPKAQVLKDPPVRIQPLRQDAIEGENDVLVYLTGLIRVPKLETLGFLPGAIADHLTSAGGDLLGNAQMSSLRWLEAGATASYGAVSEPCNHWQKFPNPMVLLKHYLRGETAIEAYWKSVAWPAQGLFIGEPLAAPYAR